jgi:hypothetical protein
MARSESAYDFRNDVAGDGMLTTDHWLIHCHSDCDNPSRRTDETRITPVSFDMRLPRMQGFFVGDYVGLSSIGDDFASLLVTSPAPFPQPMHSSR